MNRPRTPAFWASFLLLNLIPASLSAQEWVRHEIRITVLPQEHQLKVQDIITLPQRSSEESDRKRHFLLHEGLKVRSTTSGVQIVREKGPPRPESFGLAETLDLNGLSTDVPLAHYSVTLPQGQRQLVLSYEGRIHHPIEQGGQEYGRGPTDSPGLISPKGVYLYGASYWYPWFNDELITFDLDVKLPGEWSAVSQGQRKGPGGENGETRFLWESPEPQEEIYLIAGPLTEYIQAAGAFEAMVFLRQPDQALADRYLEATGRYLDLYNRLIGPYPYKKFALVENFWETGYGMPSFTLLGPTVIRLPFIPDSSYPHEILHNWWGNGVFVESASGNWSEGLTTYLADHLLQERSGGGTAYRRSTLQRYTDYVRQDTDFPLSRFRSRHNMATQAVGYGKTLMFFHMLRIELGDPVFTQGLRAFYKKNRFRRASFKDLEKSFSSAAGKDLESFFAQWIHRSGAPTLRLAQVSVEAETEGFALTVLLEQVQPGPVYTLNIPIAVHLEGRRKAYQSTLDMKNRRQQWTLPLPARPLHLDVDPQFDVFRRLDRREIPPALTQAFGNEKGLILLPASEKTESRKAYRSLAESWRKKESQEIEVRLDNEVDSLPGDRTVWLFGWENRFRAELNEALREQDVHMNKDRVQIGMEKYPRADYSVVISARHPANSDLALVWVAAQNEAALPGLGRKLPHYGKYSYLVFQGDEPVNRAKGQWTVFRSPLSAVIPYKGRTADPSARGVLAPRRALVSPIGP